MYLLIQMPKLPKLPKMPKVKVLCLFIMIVRRGLGHL